MKKRSSFSYYSYLAFALILLLASWESARANAALFVPDTLIPEQSIRLRILAHSDNPADQWIKRQVRDAIIDEMDQWVTNPRNLHEARRAIQEHMPELNERVGQVLKQNGSTNTYTVELGRVPFPTKMYGNAVYPAGDYEAVRVVLGAGQGQNWWCVLFPPLCFVDLVGGEAVAQVDTDTSDSDDEGEQAAPKEADLQVRFFILDLLHGVMEFIRSLLH